MSTVEFEVNNPLSNEAWEAQLNVESIEETQLHKFIGKSAQSMVQKKGSCNQRPAAR